MTPEQEANIVMAVNRYHSLYNPNTGDPNRALLKKVARWYRLTWRTLRDALEVWDELNSHTDQSQANAVQVDE
jgi:hypothetical protein